MNTQMEDNVKRWMVKSKTALILGVIQGKTTVTEVRCPLKSAT